MFSSIVSIRTIIIAAIGTIRTLTLLLDSDRCRSIFVTRLMRMLIMVLAIVINIVLYWTTCCIRCCERFIVCSRLTLWACLSIDRVTAPIILRVVTMTDSFSTLQTRQSSRPTREAPRLPTDVRLSIRNSGPRLAIRLIRGRVVVGLVLGRRAMHRSALRDVLLID